MEEPKANDGETSSSEKNSPDLEQNAPGPHSSEEATRVASSSSRKPQMGLTREIAFISIISSAQLLTQAGLGQAIAPLHLIAESFGDLSPGELSWFPAAYSLTVGTFILVAGRVGDILGHKPLFIFGYLWFSLWSLLAGFSVYSRSQVFFDFCRSMQGIGPAVLLPCSLAIFGQTYPPGRRKDLAFGIFGGVAPCGFVLGAVFSSLVSQLAWWPWAYWLMAIVCTLCAVIGAVVIPAFDDDATSGYGLQSFDYLGSLIGITGLVLFNIAWNQAPVVGWQSPYVIVFLILGLLCLTAFFLVERRVKQPLLPLDGLPKEIIFVLGCVALGWSSFGIWMFYLWQFLGQLRADTPLSISAQTVPAPISGFCAALLTGVLLRNMRTAYVMVMAMTAFCVGIILLATMPVQQTYWIQTFLSVIITPFGMDFSFPAATIILSNLMPKRHQGIAASLVTTVVNYSISIGLGIAGTVESHVNSDGSNPLLGFRSAWYTGIGLSGLGILLSIYFLVVDHRKG